ncbi:hypothetical protein LWC34_42465 [Kibdelosporangium philippinense]|uniref:Uncharacterized protein n=1 Tax=Kibdelosporangium philippinense TaxID=211113 RepID=A0ABS8ZNU7_9PSEU|nr:hypothetical protein [Kibdelosporangium philippinense]MCE7009435.1 hypothetical protein [Kibdelosporangium philippinense]
MRPSDHKWAEVVNVFYNCRVDGRDATFGVSGAQGTGHFRRETGRLDANDVTRVLAHFAEPPRQEAVQKALATDHMVAIEGPHRTGKRSGAIVALHRKAPDDIFVLSPVSTLKELAKHDYERGKGYLVDHVGIPAAEPEQTWGAVRDVVREAGAFLVVTLQKPADVDVVLCVHWERPPLEDVLHAHLPGDESLHHAFPADYDMTAVAKAAARIRAGTSVDEVLAGLSAKTSFEDGHIPELVTLVFSPGVELDEFDRRLAALKARMPGTAPESDLITVDENGVRQFKDPGDQTRVLAELNERLPKAGWDSIRAWLHEIVRENDLPVASGLAKLAEIDLVDVERSFLQPWSAGDIGWRGQTTATLVLWTMCLQESSLPIALRIVKGWAQQGTATQRQTAAVALSGEIGVRFPAEAVDEIWRLLQRSSPSDEGVYTAAVARLFATLAQEGDDSGLVLELLGHRLNAEKPASQQVLRSVLDVLSVRHGLADDLAVGTFLDREPERAELVGTLWDAALREPGRQREALDALLAGFERFTPEQAREIREVLAKRQAHTWHPPPETFTEEEEDPEPYPVVERRPLRPARKRLLRKSRTDEVSKPQAHEVLVYEVDGSFVLEASKSATSVAVVDMTRDKPVVVSFLIRSRERTPFAVRVTFACTVTDPVRVVADDARTFMHNRLTSHRRVFQLGTGRAVSEVDVVRRDVTAQIRAFLHVRPMSMTGLTIRLADVDVLAYQVRDEDVS